MFNLLLHNSIIKTFSVRQEIKTIITSFACSLNIFKGAWRSMKQNLKMVCKIVLKMITALLIKYLC